MKVFALLVVGAAADCTGKSESDCHADSTCSWCISAAVPSACNTVEDAKSLPSAVFQCDNLGLQSGDDMSWEDFKQQFGKTYNGPEEDERKAIFEENKKMWGQHESGAILGATVFSDLTHDEFKALNIRGFQAGSASGLPKLGLHEYQGEELAASIDWTTKGAVTPVKNQGQCGSCWSFSTTGGIEGSYQIASGNLQSLSEQQFVDCSKQNSGCNGGLMDYAFSFAKTTALATESSYPYTARDGTCKSSFTTAIPQGGVTGYKDVSTSASSLISALNSQPVSVAIQADQAVFQQYTGGVITSGCGSQLDHGVLAVGYDGNTIKVKNSWGASWGVNGYVQMDASQCGITQSASYPTVSAGVEV
jgi:cathepsin L